MLLPGKQVTKPRSGKGYRRQYHRCRQRWPAKMMRTDTAFSSPGVTSRTLLPTSLPLLPAVVIVVVLVVVLLLSRAV